MAINKTELLTVRFNQEQIDDFKLAVELEGGTMSSVIRTFVYKKIRDAKEREPQAFARHKNEYERPVVTARIKRSKGKVKRSKA